MANTNDDKAIMKIENVCFVGAGTMGCYNALVASLSGYKVTVFDTNKENLTLMANRQQEFSEIFLANGIYNPTMLEQAIANISSTTDLAKAVENADLVSESVFEQLDIKRQVHQQLDQLCPAHTILTTNSSGLLVSDIEDIVERGERFVALHTHLLSPLVDIVKGPRTSVDIVSLLKNYVESLGAVPLVLNKENPGYVLNAMIAKLLSTAMLLVVDNNIDFEAIDKAWMQNANSTMGPFGMLDMFGLDITQYGLQIEEPNGRMKQVKAKLTPFIADYIDKGLLGVKTGQGFYHYPNPAFKQQDFLLGDNSIAKNNENAFIYQRLSFAIIIGAVLLAANDIAEQEDVDKAWMVGMMLPKGPFVLLTEMGVEAFKESLQLFVEFGSILPGDAEKIEKHLHQLD